MQSTGPPGWGVGTATQSHRENNVTETATKEPNTAVCKGPPEFLTLLLNLYRCMLDYPIRACQLHAHSAVPCSLLHGSQQVVQDGTHLFLFLFFYYCYFSGE